MRIADRKRILVTGGAGFLGSHLCDRLLAEGNDVLCVDNFYSGTKDNVAHLMGNPHFELMRHDVTFPLYVEVDEIYNLACPASPVHYQRDPVQTTKTSVHGAINMLGLAKRTKARILQASTSEVYGDPEIHPQPESYWGRVNPLGIRTVGELVEWLRTRSGGHAEALAAGAAFGAAVDQRTATFDVKLAGAREVAFFPPFTGG